MHDRLRTDELTRCQERIAELQEENGHLRESSRAFADLAERLHQRLERRRDRSDDAKC